MLRSTARFYVRQRHFDYGFQKRRHRQVQTAVAIGRKIEIGHQEIPGKVSLPSFCVKANLHAATFERAAVSDQL